jgi:AraC family transcriptional regulator of adaptative response / DNA-3-methyladenine glycosylase II
VIHVAERAAQLVGLESEPVLATVQLTGDPVIGPLIKARPGLRVPGVWGPFEIAVAAIIRDQLGAERTRSRGDADGSGQDHRGSAAAELLAQLIETVGTPVAGLGHGLTHAFPSAETLATRYDQPGQVGDTLRALAEAVAAGNIRLDGGEPLETLVPALTAIDGISELAAHHIALRLGARDAFPAKPTTDSDAWRPWRALAYTHLVSASDSPRMS